MSDDSEWDYSEIPEKKWTWDFVEDHWMDCIVNAKGLTYYGTDWTCQSGGGYFGGFQTFEEFLKYGSICKMPKKAYKEVSKYLKEHRKAGGSTLHLVYVHKVKGFHLKGVFVHLDDKPILVKNVRPRAKLSLFNGSIGFGEHIFSYVFVLVSKDGQKKVSGESKITIKDGVNQAILETTEDEEGILHTKIADEQ